jgi:hypothetical protein
MFHSRWPREKEVTLRCIGMSHYYMGWNASCRMRGEPLSMENHVPKSGTLCGSY